MERDQEYHDRLYAAAGNETLSHHLRLLNRQAVLFWTQAPEPCGHLKDVIVDFRETLRAAKERDSQACARLLRRHVLDHVERIRKSIKPDELQYGVVRNYPAINQ
jgi:DNA-binding GntR family transcriptional regulator